MNQEADKRVILQQSPQTPNLERKEFLSQISQLTTWKTGHLTRGRNTCGLEKTEGTTGWQGNCFSQDRDAPC